MFDLTDFDPETQKEIWVPQVAFFYLGSFFPKLRTAAPTFGGWPRLNSENCLWVAYPLAFGIPKGGVFVSSFCAS
jgi:hypothetical protein